MGAHLEDSHHVAWQLPDNLFSLFYFLELLARISLHRFYFVFCADWKWHLLDCMVVLSSIEQVFQDSFDLGAPHGVSLGILRLLRLMKIVKLFRVVRLKHSYFELRLILTSITG